MHALRNIASGLIVSSPVWFLSASQVEPGWRRWVMIFIGLCFASLAWFFLPARPQRLKRKY